MQGCIFHTLLRREERGDGQLGLFLMTRQCLLLLFSLAVRWAMLAFFKSKLLLRDWKVRATWFRWTTLISSRFIFYILCLLYSSASHYNGWKEYLCIIRANAKARILRCKGSHCTPPLFWWDVSRTRVYDFRFFFLFLLLAYTDSIIKWTKDLFQYET